MPKIKNNQTAAMDYILEHFADRKWFSVYDIRPEGYQYTQIKCATQQLEQKGILVRITNGIYALPGTCISEEDHQSAISYRKEIRAKALAKRWAKQKQKEASHEQKSID